MTIDDATVRSCATATSPLAYLADLLDYAAKHVRDASASLTLPEMAARFQQPLADLPGSCASMEREVNRVRLVVEVLRGYLASRALPAAGSAAQAALAAAEQAYRTAAYEALLGRLGTSSEQVGRAARAPAEERGRLAARLGIAVDKLNALAIAPPQLSEPALEQLFGLADTRRDVLSDGAKSGDAQNQVSRWRLDGVAWAANTDADGAVHVRVRKVGTNFQVSLFRDSARSQQVAAGARTTATGPVALRPVGTSGLSGQLTINYTADSDAVSIAAVPMALAWRLQNARAQPPSPESPEQAQARVDQELALAAQWKTAVSESEAATLPALRDALVLASDAVGADASAKARWLTDRLLIDAEVAPSLSATRASQAIETVQGLLVSLRTGQISDSHPDLTLVAERFDEEWTWLGSYATWRAAVAVYLYPENLLLPTLRRRQTPAFRELASDLRNGRRFTPAQARTVARAYEDYFRDVCSLTVHSSCLAVSRPGGDAADKTLFHLFAVGGKTKSLYWSAGDVAAAADPAQTFWERLPKPAGFERLVASIPYETSEPRRFIYLFAQTNDRGTPGLAYLRHDLDNPSWEAEWTVLELPEGSGRHDITPVQSQAAGEPPAFFIRVQAGLYVRGLDEEGDTWESPGADDESTDVWAAFRVPGLVAATPVAVVRTAGQPAGTYWLCQHVKGRGVIVRKQGGLPSAPNDAFAAVEIGGADARFAGAFAREGADEIVVFHGTGRAGRGTRAGSVITPPGPAELKYRRVRVGNAGTDRTATALTGVRSLVPRFDAGKENQRQTAWQKSGERMRGVMSFNATTEAITVSGAVPSAPKVDALIPIAEDRPGVNQNKRRADILAAVEGNKTVEANLAYVAEACFFVPTQIALQLQVRGQFTAALDWFRSVYDYRLPEASRKIYHGLRLEESLPAPPAALSRAADWLLDPLNPHAIAATRRGALSRGTLLSLLGCFLDFADAEFTRDTVESLPRARMLYITALELLGAPELQGGGPQTLATPVPGPTGNFGVLVNPLFAAQRFRADNNLFKLRTGRNIAGLEREVEPYVAPTGSALPAIGTGGQIVLPGSVSIRPTPYRYSVLVERARQLVQLASQMEAAMLAALEKRDAELYNLLKARQDVDLTRAGVRLQDLRVREAEDGVKLAELQRDRAQSQADYYQERLDERLLALELLSMIAMGAAIGLEATAAGILLAASGITLGVTAVPGFQAAATAASSTASLLATMASYERRRQEWEFQHGLSVQDVRIGSQQVKLADDHVRIAGQERTIADMQAGHAEAALEFLAGKFTNAELFDWMSGVLERVYAYFLQQASAVARLAENQLAFERQETPPAIIQADYWEVPADSAEESTDRRGLTGSARLLQDLTRLDQHAFETDKRKLQLTRTFSLARLAPVEFQQFRETGSILFATPMELFDRDFPGHYLRLIKRVRTSVIALIPPGEGVRATLSTPGTSRVTIGGGPFQTIVASQGPQSVALTSAQNASGVFELDLQPELLLPFEGSGVDTVWHLAMPKAANPFDYGTLADVLLTIEYTALDSADYRQQMIATLDPALSASRPFGFRHQFADAWYDLHNPTQTAQPMTVRFKTRREDFPPNVEAVRVQHLALYFSRAAGQTFEVQVDRLRLSAQGNAAPVNAAAATSVNGIISTRLANGGPWTAFLGQEPFGEWELTLPDTAEMRARFENEAIEDILFVITYTGRTPPWPTMP